MIDTKPILRAFLQKREIVRQHLDSFNDFVENRLQQIIDEIKKVETDVGIDIEFGKIEVDKAEVIEADGSKNRILPREARLRNLNYFSPIYLEMRLVQEWKEGKWERVKIGMLPTMVKSKICNLYGMSREEKLKYLRERFFPEPDEKDLLLARPLEMDATSPEKGRKLKNDETIEDMIKKGWLAEEEGKYYLTQLGVKVAKVTLEMYPEG